MRISVLRSPGERLQTPARTNSLAVLLTAAVAVAILVLGAWLRLHALGMRGFWGDEIWTAQASVSPPSDILRYYLNFPGPLYYLLGHAALVVLPNVPMELTLRLPSAIASVLCLVVFFALARRYAGRSAALVGTLLLAVAPYQVWYAQEARFYAWSTLLALIATYTLLRALDEPRSYRFWVVFGVSSVANLYNQPLPAAVALAGQLVLIGFWLLIYPPRRLIIIKSLVTYLVIALSYLPVFLRVNTTGRMDVFRPQTFLAYHVYDFWVTLVGATRETIDKFATGGSSSWLFLVFFLLGLAAMTRRRQWKLLLVCVIPMLTALLAFGLGRPRTGFIVRYVLYLQPFYLLAVAAGIVAVGAWLGRIAGRASGNRPSIAVWGAGIVVLLLAVLLSTFSLLQVRQSYSLAKINDWRAIARYLDAHTQPGDLIVGNRWFKAALSWYMQHGERVTTSTDRNVDVLEDLYRGRRIWYLRLGPTKGNVSPVLQRRLEPVAPAAWEEAGLDYMTSNFFPASEYMVLTRFGGDGVTAAARFYDELPTVEGDNSYRILKPGESAEVQLVLPADKGARSLEITRYHNPQATLAVTMDGEAPVLLHGPAYAWQETRLPIPASAGDTVTVRVESVGERPVRLHQLRLVYD